MARYPGSQFIVIDNSATTATVPIATKNPAAPTYLTTFASVKGPEEIRTVSGQEFFDLYGSQSTILFSKYGQPLLQAAMNINAGAQLICKRAVLEDAKLANVTFGVVASRYVFRDSINGNDFTTELYSDQEINDTPASDSNIFVKKTSSNKNILAINVVSKKENNFFKFDENTNKWYIDYTKFKINLNPIVYSISDKYKYTTLSDDPVFNDNTGKIDSKFLYNRHKESIIEEITDNNPNLIPMFISDKCYTDDQTYSAYCSKNLINDSTDTFDKHSNGKYSNDIVTMINNYAAHKNITLNIKKEYDSNSTADEKNVTRFIIESTDTIDIYKELILYLVTSYQVYPLFTIFDNGRGTSTKSISITQDINSSKILKKVIYTLKVIDNKTNKTLESFPFCIDPYTRNNNGQTLDIETNINYNSKQINVKMHYDHYDKLLNELQDSGADPDLFINNDCLFGHDIYGSIVKDNEIIPGILKVNTDYSAEINNSNNYSFDNLDKVNEKTDNIAYSYYDYKYRTRKKLTDRLYFGNDGTKSYNGEETKPDRYYDKQYKEFFDGTFDRDIFNLDYYFPNCIFDANYEDNTKMAIQKLSAFRGDMLAYLDMGINKIKYCSAATDLIPNINDDINTNIDTDSYAYIRDMHNAVTCVSYDIKDPYTNKQISVTATYGLSIIMVNHYITGMNKVFAGKNNGITFTNAIKETVNFIPKIYPTTDTQYTSSINNVYPSDDMSIINEKQIMNDSRINYGSYYEDVFTMDTQYTLNETESEFSYINNVMLVNALIQDIRKACPSARYSFIDGEDLEKYKKAVTTVINAHRSKFAQVEFKYLKDENSINNKIFYAALEVTFRPFAQAEIFTITALNYSTLDSNVTTA